MAAFLIPSNSMVLNNILVVLIRCFDNYKKKNIVFKKALTTLNTQCIVAYQQLRLIKQTGEHYGNSERYIQENISGISV